MRLATAARRLAFFSTAAARPLQPSKQVKVGIAQNFAHDKVIERALEQRRLERQKQGLETSFQKQVDEFLAMWAMLDQKKTKTKAQIEADQKEYVRQVDANGEAHATGRRKTATAHVWIRPGNGLDMVVRHETEKGFKLMTEYFDRFQLNHAVAPLKVIDQLGKFNVRAIVSGGGKSGQSGAISLGIARALQNWDPNFRPVLKADGLLTRDARVVERKKPGQKKARKKFQWVKR